MDYTQDRSDFDSVPVELYHFKIGSGEGRTEIRLTNHDHDVVWNGDIFYSEIIERPEITIDGDHEAEQRFSLDLDASSRLAAQYFYSAPADGDTLDIYRCQANDIDNTITFIWRGMLVGVERDYPRVLLSCQSIKSLYNGTGCYTRYTRGRCRHRFMEPSTCKYSEPSFDAIVYLVTGSTNVFQFMEPQLVPPKGLEYYNGGVFSYAGQNRTIMGIDSGALRFTVDLPFIIAGDSDPVFPGRYLGALMPGCDLSASMCKTKFDNINNYGAYDDMPIGSGPFGGVPMYNTTFTSIWDMLGLDDPDKS